MNFHKMGSLDRLDPNLIPRVGARQPQRIKKEHWKACICIAVSILTWGLLQYFGIPNPLNGITFFFIILIVTFLFDSKSKCGDGQPDTRLGRYKMDVKFNTTNFESRNWIYQGLRSQDNCLDDPNNLAEALGFGNELLRDDIQLIRDPWTESAEAEG